MTYDTINWLKRFMLLGCIILISWITAIILNLDKVLNPDIFIYYPLRLSSSILLFWLGFQGFTNYNLLSERTKIRKFIETENKNQPISLTPKNTNLQKEKFFIIDNYIKSNTSYLNPNFNLENLSKELKISTSSISITINKESNYNFPDYINSFRVEKAKEYLVLNDFKEYTIVAIGLECGFNSKSAFYSSFKKFTGITPLEYRKK